MQEHTYVLDAHPNIQNDVLALFRTDDAGQHLPGMQFCISFQKVVKTAITADLKLSCNAISITLLLQNHVLRHCSRCRSN